jgi:hypothetical protein
MTDRPREPGYRGSLPPRDDVLARVWVLVVIAIFLLMFILSFLRFPSVLFPEETPLPLPSIPAASGSPTATESAEPTETEEPTESPSPTAE